MRWPFRTRAAAPAQPVPVPPTQPARPERRAWQSLAPIAPVVTRPRITVGRPEVVGSRSLLHRPEPPRREERPAGRVTGLADVLPALDVEYAKTVAPKDDRPVVPRTPTDSPLTAATPEYVGEPRVPAVPHRAPGWLRALSGAPMLDPLLGSVMPGIAPSPSGNFPPMSPPAVRPAPARPVAAPAPRPVTPRPIRPAGRLGLGAPLRPVAGDPKPDPKPEPDPEPDPPAPPHSATPVVTGPPPSATAARSAVVPADLARAVGTAAGADVDGVLVHRGPEVDRRAGEIGAVAFAVDDAVHLGTVAGPDDGPAARALVAHELTHVAQQRRFGAALPDEGSPAGAALEAEALAVEDAVRSGRSLPRLNHPRPPAAPSSGSVDARPRTSAQGSLFQATIDVAAPVGGSFRGPASRAAEPVRGSGSTGSATTGPASARPTTASPGLVIPSRVSATAVRPASMGSASSLSEVDGLPRVESGAVVRGRVQRRTVERSHPAAAQPEPAAAAVPVSPAPTATTPAATDERPSMSTFGKQVSSELGGMVLSSWSLEETQDKPATTAGAGAGTGDDSREARFNRIAGPALARLNEQRMAAGQPDLPALPEDEERRIWDQVDQGAGGGPAGAGSGQRSTPAIRNWSDFGGAITNDVTDQVGGSFGMDLTEVIHHHAVPETAVAAPPAATAAAADHHSDPGHHGERPPIDTDDLDLDELGHRLYDRIRSRLRLELLLDRERAGLLSDFR